MSGDEDGQANMTSGRDESASWRASAPKTLMSERDGRNWSRSKEVHQSLGTGLDGPDELGLTNQSSNSSAACVQVYAPF